MPEPDPEEVLRVMAQLREEHPHASDESLRRLIDWPALRRIDETRDEYAERMHGPLVPP